MITKDNFTRIKNDVNGNPRYVIHFLDFITDAEHERISNEAREYNQNKQPEQVFKSAVNEAYELAIKRAKTIGGKRYNTKDYDGGIVFQSYNIYELAQAIENLKN